MYKWQTDGSISWKDGNAGIVPELPLSEDGGDWTDAYSAFNTSWSLLGIINGIVSYVTTARYWLDPVISSTLTSPPVAPPTDGDRYLINGTGGGGWTGHSNCIAQYDGGLAAWIYYEDGGTPPNQPLLDGASVWDETNNTYWVFNNNPSPEWVQCGGTTLEKIIPVSALGPYFVDGMTERGATFVGAPGGGTTTFVLPACAEGLKYRFIRDSATGSTSNHVEISVLDTELLGIYSTQRQFALDAESGSPYFEDQLYRKVRLVSRWDSITVLGTKYGWAIIEGIGTFQDVSPKHDGTIQGAADNTHITLEATASLTNADYIGRLIYITSCPAYPTAVGQIRLITAYNGTSKVATVYPAWSVDPDDGTGTYEMVRYDAVPVAMGEVGSIYFLPKKDQYDLTGAPFSKSGYPTMGRYAGLNMSDTWGALLLGRTGHAEAGAKYASAFGRYAHIRWDSQFCYGATSATVNRTSQISRILMFGTPKAGSGFEAMRLGVGAGETAFTTQNRMSYYVTFNIVARYATSKLISWSGSFLAVQLAGVLAIVAGSENITETGNSGTPALELDIDVDGTDIQFLLKNSEVADLAVASGFADVIELELDPAS